MRTVEPFALEILKLAATAGHVIEVACLESQTQAYLGRDAEAAWQAVCKVEVANVVLIDPAQHECVDAMIAMAVDVCPASSVYECLPGGFIKQAWCGLFAERYGREALLLALN